MTLPTTRASARTNHGHNDEPCVTPPPVTLHHGAAYSSTSPRLAEVQYASHWPSLHPRGLSSGLTIAGDFSPGTAQQKPMPARKSKPRATTRKKTAAPQNESLAGDSQDTTEPFQAKRKSEIEKKSRLKRASKIDTMKADVARLEQNLLRLTDHCREKNEFTQPAHLQLPLHSRLLKLRKLLAGQFQQSVQLRNEHFHLYQRLQHFVDINESLHNVVSAHSFTNPCVYDLLSWWKPPSDAQCIQLAQESIAKILSFQFSTRHVTDHHAGWGLSYEHSQLEGCKFTIARDISMVNAGQLAQTAWEARSTTQGAARLAAGVCKAEVTILKTVNKDMVIVNRSLRFPEFTLHSLYLLFRTEINGVPHCVSRELGRSQARTWDQSKRDFPETSAEKWMDVFTWSSFEKIPYDPAAVECRSNEHRHEEGPDGKPETYRAQYCGWWGTSFALGVQRWLLEMLFMVVRWEALYIQPRTLLALDSHCTTDKKH